MADNRTWHGDQQAPVKAQGYQTTSSHYPDGPGDRDGIGDHSKLLGEPMKQTGMYEATSCLDASTDDSHVYLQLVNDNTNTKAYDMTNSEEHDRQPGFPHLTSRGSPYSERYSDTAKAN